jgi:hypothetical protein
MQHLILKYTDEWVTQSNLTNDCHTPQRRRRRRRKEVGRPARRCLNEFCVLKQTVVAKYLVSSSSRD